MTTAAENDILTRVGPGTPMGELMRRYWIPGLMSSELTSDGDPVRFKLLGEELIAFRDTSGRIGVMDHRCPHRCASLFFGRNEEGGLRCVYHGWKFDVDGKCLDMANVPPHQDFKHKVHAKTYKSAERAGLIWVYMGDQANVPDLPPIETSLLPAEIVSTQMHLRNCNWLQALEGELDTSHVGLLHYGSVGVQNFQADGIRKYSVTSRAPEYMSTETDAGFMYGAYRPADEGNRYWRIAHFLFPFWAMPPINAIEINFLARAYVPVDDEHTMSTYIILKGTEPTRREATGRNIPGATLDLDYLPNTTDWLGRFRLATNAQNDYQIDREKQRTNSYTGINGITLQDHAITESMGPITDRTHEHLAPSDMTINRVRRLLIKAAGDLQKTGTAPKSATDPSVYDGLRGGQFVAPEGQDWLEAWRENLEDAAEFSAGTCASGGVDVMTTAAENDILTRVGAGTPMGDLIRQYWIPALKSSELKTDGDPVRFKLLGEQLIAFRDTSGRIGVMDHRCPHRCASLFFGRNEEGGIRCVYHGWKFDVDGNCLDMANVPAHQDFKHKVHAKTYKVSERNGLVWVFMGDQANVPELPPLEATLVPEEYMDIDFHMRDCNWLQALEGEIDSSHVAWLHYGLFQKNDFSKDSIRGYQVATRAPGFVTKETDAGFMYGVHRPADDGNLYWRIAHFAFPCWALPPINNIEFNFLARAYVPLDDTHTMCVVLMMKGDPYKKEIAKMPGGRMQMPLLPNSTDWLGRFRVEQNAGNDYLIDREVQRTVTFTGIEGIISQDHAITESMGGIVPRELEHLAPSDQMITQVRRMLVRSARDHAKDGTLPKSASDPSVYAGVRSGQFVAPETQDWLAATAEKVAANPLNYSLAQAAE